MAAKPEVAFIGLGAMGFGMATQLLKQGFDVTGFDVWAPTLERFVAAGGKSAATPAAAVAGRPVCVCMVATGAQAQAVLVDGPDAAAAAMPPNAALLLCSTVPCGYVQALARELADPAGAVRRPDILLVDCPVSGGTGRAADGTLSLMIGTGPDAAAHPSSAVADVILAALADPTRLYRLNGGIGAGSNAKMVHQVLAVAHIVGGPEAMGFAVRLGLPANEDTLNALLASPGGAWMLGQRGPRIITNFLPLSSAIAIATKDAGIITGEARRTGFVAPLSNVVENAYFNAIARGYGPDDDSSLLRLYTTGLEYAPPLPSALANLPAKDRLQFVVNLLQGIHLITAAESLAFAKHVGLDLDQMLDLFVNAAGGTAMLTAHGASIVAALRNGKAASGWAAESTADGTLESIVAGLEASLDVAQQIKAPLYLGTQAYNLGQLALRSIGKQFPATAAGSIIKLWA
ncbi:3-hydroxyacid dehydrogenase/reductase [Niveomyces insectorum RCEF 264]|uniref:3-hydroxyacid dehydrogenase/reductase n=1 Tax=Niveomyces insectorum RCEF 264 TaxID=1081102 RepID=A0A167XNR1_9HYPO|nr:3-hydroxyacid dehydrogenase/reductase [Niveomyces insectorum RCEF 264]